MRGRKVEMEMRSVTETATGTGLTTTYTGLRRVQGTFRLLSANESLAYQKREMFATHRFVFDTPPGLVTVDPAYRWMMVDDSRQYVTVNANSVGGLGLRWVVDLLEVR